MELFFESITDAKGEALQCCMCGNVDEIAPETNYLKADITIAVQALVTIYVCGATCKKNLFNSKTAMRNLEEGIRNVRRAHRKQALKKMGRRFGVLIFFFLALACGTQKKVQHNPRYRQQSLKELNEWLDAEYPRKVVPTGEKKRKRSKK